MDAEWVTPADMNSRASSCPSFSTMSTSQPSLCPATAALDSHPISPRIPPALQALYVQANSDQPLTVCPDLVAKALTPFCKGSVPHHKKKHSNKFKQQPPFSQKKSSIPRVVTLTAADAATASIKTRQLQVALEGCTMNEAFSAQPPLVSTVVTPLEYLHSILSERGYSTKSYPTLQSGFVATPTEIQQASYHMHMISLVRKNDIDTFKKVMLSGLVSPNPCNQFGESLLHMVCRRGRFEMLHIMLQAGASVHVVDDFGRTPLADACWASETAFDVVRALLDLDARLINMSDLRGSLPLSYVPKKDHGAWIKFLDSIKDTYWPHRGVSPAAQGPPPITLEAPRSRTPPQPRIFGVTKEVASLVASGQLSPDDVIVNINGSSTNSSRESSSEESKMESSECDDDDGDRDDDDESMNSEEDCSDSWSDDDEEDDSLSSFEIKEIYSHIRHAVRN